MARKQLSSPGLAVALASAALLLVLTGAFTATAATAEADAAAVPAARPDAFAAARAVLDARFQTDLPTLEIPADPAAMPATVLSDTLLKILLVLAAVLVAVVVANTFYGSGRFDLGGDGEGIAGAGGPDFDALQVPDPDRLGAEGRYAEAIHALLLRALIVTAGRLDAAWPRSLTSREILRHRALPDAARGHLGQLIERVEVHHFGGFEPADTDFVRCREVYARLVAALGGASP